MRTNHSATLGLVSMALLAQTGCEQPKVGAPESKRPRLVFITAGTNSFWQNAAAGMEAAATDFQAEYEVIPEAQAVDRSDADGMAFVPIDGTAQLVSSLGKMCFLGVDHYKSGRKAGELAKEALPNGGKIIIINGTQGSDERRQGVMDELSDTQLMVAEASVREVIHGDAACVVALSARDLFACLEALCAADKLAETKVIGFDEVAPLEVGDVYGIVTQQPYQYGYHAVRVLAGLARGDRSVLPRSGLVEIPTVVLRRGTSRKFTVAAQ